MHFLFLYTSFIFDRGHVTDLLRYVFYYFQAGVSALLAVLPVSVLYIEKKIKINITLCLKNLEIRHMIIKMT